MAIAFTDQPTSGPFHRTTLWHRTAPRKLFKAWFSGDDERRWVTWRKYLSQRREPELIPFLIGKRPPILWGWPEDWRRDEIAHVTSALARSNAVHAASRSIHLDASRALEAVAAAYALPDLARELPAGAWWSMAETLYHLAGDAQQLRVESRHEPEQILRQQLLAGELPLVLSFMFPELQPMRSLRQRARQSLSEALIETTDGEGLPHARMLRMIGPLWACWTRARLVGEHLKRGAWSRDAETQYQWLVRRMIRLVDGAGCVFSDGDGADEASNLKSILTAALKLVGDEGDCAAASSAVAKSVVPRSLKFDPKKLPDPSLESAWSCLAVLAGDWSKQSPRLTVAFADNPLRLELHIGGRQILAGEWLMNSVCDGNKIQPTEAWQELCWQSDKKCDYLELGIELENNVRLERQIVFAKRDGALLIADILVSNSGTPHDFQHSFSLPLARHVAWRPEIETRDGVLVVGKQQTAVLPLGLCEWRSDPRGGTLTCENGRVTLTEKGNGRALYTGLLLDLDPARSKRPRTWRQLTIAESRIALPCDVAVGFRAQSGCDQWLVYRSLGPAGNRSVLGQNISSEFYAGRFRETGLVDEWVEIEAETQ